MADPPSGPPPGPADPPAGGADPSDAPPPEVLPEVPPSAAARRRGLGAFFSKRRSSAAEDGAGSTTVRGSQLDLALLGLTEERKWLKRRSGNRAGDPGLDASGDQIAGEGPSDMAAGLPSSMHDGSPHDAGQNRAVEEHEDYTSPSSEELPHHMPDLVKATTPQIPKGGTPNMPQQSPTATSPGGQPFSLSIEEVIPGRHVEDLNRGPISALAAQVGWKRALLTKAKRFLKENWGLLIFVAFGALALAMLGIFSFDDPFAVDSEGNALPVWKGWFSLGTMLVLLAVLVKGSIATHVAMLSAVTVLLMFKIIEPSSALVGFSNTGVATVAVLFMVAEGVQRTSLLQPVFRFLLGKPKSLWEAQLRLTIPTAIVSAFLNNTPVVAMMIPIVQKWARRSGLPVSRLLMPLNNATILGGTATLLGTSTNLVVVALAEKEQLDIDFPLFEIAQLGVPSMIIGLVYMLIFSRFLLRDRTENLQSLIRNPREYTVALVVTDSAPIVGETVQEAGLRQLSGLFLIEITRMDGEVVPAVSPDTRLHAGDILLFAGVVETVTELYLIPGLAPATAQTDKIQLERHRRRLVEIVISPSSRLVGQTAKSSKFRSKFGCAIIAVHRRGEHVKEKIGDIELRAGDTLLVESSDEFVARFGKNPNFALVAEVGGSQPPRSDKAHMAIAAVTVAAMIGVATSGQLDLLTAAAIACFILILTGCMTMENAGGAISLPVIVTIAASFGVAEALQQTGAAQQLADFIVSIFSSLGTIGLLLGIYLGTAILSSLITNNAAVAIMFPIVAFPGTGIISSQGLNERAALYTMMLAASASFSTPVGYQTNLMVHGPGGYTFLDWVKFGFPLQLILMVVAVFLANVVFPSSPVS